MGWILCYHLVLTDPDARLPSFTQYLDALVARAMNAALGRSDNFWATEECSVVELVTAEDVVDKTAYVLANPVAAGLVRDARAWPGAWSAPEQLGTHVALPRPKAQVLAITSHLPNLIAYTIVGTATGLEDSTQREVIKFSASGFRDFTRIAASNSIMWRDIFLNNREAVLEMLGRFTEDLSALQRAIRWGDGGTLFTLFSRSREIRRGIIAAGQDTAAPNFGRNPEKSQ